MKLLFDQNISFRLLKQISDVYPEAKQVKDVELENSNDSEIWKFARKNNFNIVIFDSDFYDFSVIKVSVLPTTLSGGISGVLL